MPNHVTNKLLFHPCTEQRFNEILADLQKEGAEHGSIDLGRIIPEPEGLFMGDLGVEEMKKYKDNNWYDCYAKLYITIIMISFIKCIVFHNYLLFFKNGKN